MSRLICSACFLPLFFPLFASAFVSSVKCPEPFSYCTSQQDCPLPNRLRHDGKDYMACIYNATSAIRIGVCCTDIAEDLYFDFESFDNLLSKKLVRTKRLKRHTEETSQSDLPAPPDAPMIEKSIESIPQGSLENKEEGLSGRGEETPAESTSNSPEKASGGSADRKHPPQRRPPQHSNRYSLPGYSGRPRGNTPKRRKMYINIPKPKPPPRQPKPSQSKPTPRPDNPKQQQKQKQQQQQQEQEHGKKKPKDRRTNNQSKPKVQKATKPNFNRDSSNRQGGPSPHNKNNSGNRGNKTPPNQHQMKPGRGTSKPPVGQSTTKKPYPPNQNHRKNQSNLKPPKQKQAQKKGPRRGPH